MQQVQSSDSYNYDAIIIGQGLAGSILAWELIQSGKNILLIDNHHHGSSSAVAAGIINPVTGHRVNLTEGFEKFIVTAKSSYAKLSTTFGTSFLQDIPQLRLIKNPGQLHYYHKRLKSDEYAQFIGTPINNHDLYIESPFGIANISQTFRVRVTELLATLRKYFIESGKLLEVKLDYSCIHFKQNHVEVLLDRTFAAKRIIFCEGYQAIHNPWLKNLDFKLAKGEILTLNLNKTVDQMLNWSHWLLPKSDGSAFLGSSYDWQDISNATHEETKQKLINSLNNYTSASGDIIDHKAGIRPTTQTRKQFVGQHPEHHQLYCFNGFGSKGCLTIPHYAKQLSKHFHTHQPLAELNPELDPFLGLRYTLFPTSSQ